MAKVTAKVVDQLEATRKVRRARGEFLFDGAGQVLFRIRRDKKWSLAKVAEKLGVARSTVMRYEKDRMPLSDYAVARFAEAFEMDPERLMVLCVEAVLPGMIETPFGKLLERVINSGSGTK